MKSPVNDLPQDTHKSIQRPRGGFVMVDFSGGTRSR
jgi:hypothetical protein